MLISLAPSPSAQPVPLDDLAELVAGGRARCARRSPRPSTAARCPNCVSRRGGLSADLLSIKGTVFSRQMGGRGSRRASCSPARQRGSPSQSSAALIPGGRGSRRAAPHRGSPGGSPSHLAASSAVQPATRTGDTGRGVLRGPFRLPTGGLPNPRPGRDTSSRSSAPSSPGCARRPASPTSAPSRSPYARPVCCVELKSLKLYLQRFRDRAPSTRRSSIACSTTSSRSARPRRLTIVGAFTPRGGITTKGAVAHEAGSS